MVTLPKNCKVLYFDDRVHVRMTYATTLPVGNHDGITVFANWQGRRYITFEYNVKYQHNLPMIVKDMYFQTKKKAMLFNRMKKQDYLQKEIDILSVSKIPGLWDVSHLKNDNQIPPPPQQLEIFI
jgi:hypothetical protein